jgi:hypothetical protein
VDGGERGGEECTGKASLENLLNFGFILLKT